MCIVRYKICSVEKFCIVRYKNGSARPPPDYLFRTIQNEALMNDTPTRTMYRYVEDAFDHFNRELFDGTLPKPLITFQRDKSCVGMFMYRRWQNREEKYTHEIALNPLYFVTHNPLELQQTIVHEMCHLWQYEFGTPSRRNYHNREWAQKMESIGLMPSDTGAPGGKTTGQHMSDYPLPGGRFYRACVAFERNHVLPLADRLGLFEAKQKPRNRLSPELMQALHDGLEQVEDPPAQSIDCEDDADSMPSVAAAEGMLVATDFSMVEQALYQPFPDQFILSANDDANEQEQAAKRLKVCYQCPSCLMKLWGKPGLSVICGECHQPLLVN